MQLLTTKTDPGRNTLNLQGYEIDWSYHKDSQSFGSGVVRFSNDPTWAAVPLGTAITINEWQKAWYLKNTPSRLPDGSKNPNYDSDAGTGMQRDGGISGVGLQHGTSFNITTEKILDFSSNTAWNPYAQAGLNTPAGPNWNMNVWAGQQSGGQYQYFSFSGSVTDKGVTSAIGTDAGGLFVVNNDDWQFTIRDSQGAVVQGPIGEALSGWNGGSVGSDEVGQLQATALEASHNPTLSTWQHLNIGSYSASSNSNYGGPSTWIDSKAQVSADLTPLRSWFNNIKQGDVNLDGIVNSADVTVVASNWLHSGAGLLAGDVNGDGIVNAADITIIASHWLQTGGAPSGRHFNGCLYGCRRAEPSSVVLGALAWSRCFSMRGAQHGCAESRKSLQPKGIFKA